MGLLKGLGIIATSCSESLGGGRVFGAFPAPLNSRSPVGAMDVEYELSQQLQGHESQARGFSKRVYKGYKGII